MNFKRFVAKDNKSYELRDDDNGWEISVYLNQIKMGEISFREIEVEPPEYTVYKIIGLNLEKCKGQGIGRACLQYHTEIYGCSIVAGDDTGTTSDDGSHLTGDGPGFIEKMRDEGIVCG